MHRRDVKNGTSFSPKDPAHAVVGWKPKISG